MKKTPLVIIVFFVNLLIGDMLLLGQSKPLFVKIIKTTVYTANIELEKLVKDQPEYKIGYEEALMMNLSWNNKFLDEFNNVVIQEDFRLDDQNKEVVYRTTTNEYYDAKSGKLSLVRIVNKADFIEEYRYIRNGEGRLDEIKKTKNGQLVNKIVYAYNQNGQCSKFESFFGNLLLERTLYTFSSSSLDEGKIIKEEKDFYGDYSYRQTKEYTWDDMGRVSEENDSYFKAGKMYSNWKISFSDYVGKSATIVESDGYDSLDVINNNGAIDKRSHYHKKSAYRLNELGDIETYESSVKRFDNLINAKKNHDSKVGNLSNISISCEYAYNIKKDWTKLILTVDTNRKYIVVRNISYVQNNRVIIR